MRCLSTARHIIRGPEAGQVVLCVAHAQFSEEAAMEDFGQAHRPVLRGHFQAQLQLDQDRSLVLVARHHTYPCRGTRFLGPTGCRVVGEHGQRVDLPATTSKPGRVSTRPITVSRLIRPGSYYAPFELFPKFKLRRQPLDGLRLCLDLLRRLSAICRYIGSTMARPPPSALRTRHLPLLATVPFRRAVPHIALAPAGCRRPLDGLDPCSSGKRSTTAARDGLCSFSHNCTLCEARPPR